MKRKTTIEVDDLILTRAQEVLGTSGLKDTVDRALEEVIRSALKRALMERIRSGEGWDIRDPEVVSKAQQWRTE